ncbi:external NADH-ubiquinone oxidoreductase 2, mitochondrial [Diutina catenulata]
MFARTTANCARSTAIRASHRASTTTNKPALISRVWRFTKRTTLASLLGGSAYLGYKIYDESHPGPQVAQASSFESGQPKKTLVILGTGWGSISFLKKLDTSQYNVVVVSPRNYFLFTPLLPSVPTGTLDTKSITEPVRSITRKLAGEVIYLEAEATDIDVAKKSLTIKQSTTVHSGHSGEDTGAFKSTVQERTGVEEIITKLNYDYLVVGVGAQPSTFGIPGVAENSSFLKEVSDSTAIRRRLMDAIEAANMLPKDDPERKRLLSVVVCGGGPTGVEAAGEIQDYIDQDLKKWVPDIASEMQVSLIEAQPHVLASFNPKLVEYTSHVFDQTNIKLLTSCMVKAVDQTTLTASHKLKDGTSETIKVPYGMLIWATGNAPRPLVRKIWSQVEEQKTAKRGLLVDDSLLVDGTNEIYALGDCTFTKYAPTAQVAFQEGHFLARHFDQLHQIDTLKFRIANPGANDNVERLTRKLEKLQGKPSKFVYHHMGALAYIGSEKAVADVVVADFSNIQTGGSFTFYLWRSAYIYMCLSIENQISILLDWLKVGVFGRSVSNE